VTRSPPAWASLKASTRTACLDRAADARQHPKRFALTAASIQLISDTQAYGAEPPALLGREVGPVEGVVIDEAFPFGVPEESQRLARVKKVGELSDARRLLGRFLQLRRLAWPSVLTSEKIVVPRAAPIRLRWARMSARALTVCSVPGCPNARPCPKHPQRRGSTRAWRRLRAQALRRDHGRCVECGALAVEVDHVLPRERGGRDVLENLRSLCADCHDERHGRRGTPLRERRRA
jgi:HNH endonuclease